MYTKSEVKSIEYTLPMLAPKLGITYHALRDRLAAGWLPKGWQFRKVGTWWFVSALMACNGTKAAFIDSDGLIKDLPPKNSPYQYRKALTSQKWAYQELS